MTRYTYTFATMTGPRPLVETEVALSYTVDWADDGSGHVDELTVASFDGRPITDASQQRAMNWLWPTVQQHLDTMVEHASLADAEARAEHLDRADEDRHERAWADQ